MKKIKNFKLFVESLVDDFKSYIEKDNDIKSKAESFVNALPEDKKSEFMYRVSDGEDILELIDEFLDKYNVSDKDKFKKMVIEKKIKNLQSKYNMKNLNFTIEALEEGLKDFDGIIDDFKKELESEQNVIGVINLFETSIDYLEKEQKLLKSNKNESKIEVANKIIDFLKDYI